MIDAGLLCHPTSIQMAWPGVCQLVEAHGEEWLETVELNDVFCAVMQNTLELWLGTDGSELELAMFCSWETHAHKRFYHLNQLIGKNLQKYMKEGLAKVEQYACFCGAQEVVIGGRQAWLKKLEPLGYMQKYVEVRKNVQVCWRH